MFVYGIFQKRQPRYFWAGLIHLLIFWGFVVLGLRSLDLIVQGLGGGYVLPFLRGGFGVFYCSLKDLFELTVLGACIWAILRRAMFRPVRYELENGRGHHWEAYLVLSLIGFLMLTDMFYEGGELLLSPPLRAGSRQPAWPPRYYPVWTKTGSATFPDSLTGPIIWPFLSF